MKSTEKAPPVPLGKKIRTQFLAGILVLAPVGATALILVWIFTSVDNILQPVLKFFFGHTVPGVGFGIVIILIYAIGVIATSAGKRLIRYTQSLITKIPIVSWLYTSIRQIVESFSPSGKTAFMETVLVEFPRKGMKAIGFITNEVVDKSGKKLFYIYIPNAPVPTSGVLQIMSEEEIIRTKISVNDAMKIIASAGKVLLNDVT